VFPLRRLLRLARTTVEVLGKSFYYIIYSNSVSTSQETHYFSATEPTRSLRTNNHTLPSHLSLCSLFVASYYSQGLRWRYSNPPPHGEKQTVYLRHCFIAQLYNSEVWTMWGDAEGGGVRNLGGITNWGSLFLVVQFLVQLSAKKKNCGASTFAVPGDADATNGN
jgi:hypothetical protein